MIVFRKRLTSRWGETGWAMLFCAVLHDQILPLQHSNIELYKNQLSVEYCCSHL